MCSCLTTTMQVVKTGYRRYLVDIMWICIYVGPAASKWLDKCREFRDDFWTNLSFLCSDVFCSATWCQLAHEIWKNLQCWPTSAAHELWENLTVGSPMNYVSHCWSLCVWALVIYFSFHASLQDHLQWHILKQLVLVLCACALSPSAVSFSLLQCPWHHPGFRLCSLLCCLIPYHLILHLLIPYHLILHLLIPYHLVLHLFILIRTLRPYTRSTGSQTGGQSRHLG